MSNISSVSKRASHPRRQSLFARLAGLLRAGRTRAAAVRTWFARARDLAAAAKGTLTALADWLLRSAAKELLGEWLDWLPALDQVQWPFWPLVVLVLGWRWWARRRKRGR